jgi:hypothetical protein
MEPTLAAMVVDDVRRLWRRWRAPRLLADRLALPRPLASELAAAARRLDKMRRRIHRLRKVQKLFHYWHVIHRPFALIMYLIMFIHIIVALLFGISWRTTA